MTIQGALQKLTGVPFNDAYRYMDWLLTVPALDRVPLVDKLIDEVFSSRVGPLNLAFLLQAEQ